MNTSESLKTISERLFSENICTVPLNEKSLRIIEEYISRRNANSELMRRLSTVELNYIQMRAESEDLCQEALLSKNAIITSLKTLIDTWGKKGYLKEFIFKFQEDSIEEMRSDLSQSLECVNINLNIISKSLMLLGETSAQVRACSASFLEIYHESKLAIYASLLNKDKEEVLDCRAISLQAHASSNESSRTSAHFLGVAKNCTKVIALVNTLITELSSSLYSNGTALYTGKLFSPIILSKKIAETITNLEHITLEIN